jgi:sigma-B regulation protein RsbU (phosphoserine phosphatase)
MIDDATFRTGPSPASEGRVPVILIVDDEPLNLDLLEQEIGGVPVEIYTALNGSTALEQVAAHPPDMIFLDLMMPVMDGFSVLEKLQAHTEWREIPVVIISASNDLENIVRGIEMGASDFLPKPFEPAILHARLDAGLKKKRLHDLEHQYMKSLERELEIGREIQAGFLPGEIPQPDGWQILAHFQAAREVAGDFYDVFYISPGHLGLMLGDVTDKGVGSALYMALYRSLLRATILASTLSEDMGPDECVSPEKCITRAVSLVNSYICRFHDSAMLATLFLGILDIEGGGMCYVNAGQDPPYLLRGSSNLTAIKPTGPMVGAIEEASFRVGTLDFDAGDCLVLYSDGITDAQDTQGEMYGGERFRKVLQQPSASPQQTFDAVLEGVRDHGRGMEQFDDITLLVVSRD